MGVQLGKGEKKKRLKSKAKLFAHTLISHSPINFSSDVSFCGSDHKIIKAFLYCE